MLFRLRLARSAFLLASEWHGCSHEWLWPLRELLSDMAVNHA